MFYVYEWFNKDTNEVFYVGKGSNRRYRIIAGRNNDFLNYYNTHNVDVRIVKTFELEQDSFNYEEILIKYYWSIGQCSCNRKMGGNGGVAGIWTPEMKEKMSKENPMYAEEQRLRMSIHNPMKDSIIACKQSLSVSTPVIIDGVEYESARIASGILNVHIHTIWTWCNRGYNTDGKPCRYSNEPQKDFVFKKTCSKRVLVDDKYEFSSVKEAAEFLGGNSSNLGKAIRRNGVYRGHKCSYVNQ